MNGGSLIGKTKRSSKKRRVRGDCLTQRGLARGSQAVYKVTEEGKASSKKQIPTAQAAEESRTEARRSPLTRINSAALDHTFSKLPGFNKSSAGDSKQLGKAMSETTLLWYGALDQWAGLVVPKSSSAKSSRRDSSRTKAVVKIPRA